MRWIVGAAFLVASCSASVASEAYAEKLKRKFDIWEYFEGGRACPVTPTDETSIGGLALEGDESRLAGRKLGGGPGAGILLRQPERRGPRQPQSDAVDMRRRDRRERRSAQMRESH